MALHSVASDESKTVPKTQAERKIVPTRPRRFRRQHCGCPGWAVGWTGHAGRLPAAHGDCRVEGGDSEVRMRSVTYCRGLGGKCPGHENGRRCNSADRSCKPSGKLSLRPKLLCEAAGRVFGLPLHPARVWGRMRCTAIRPRKKEHETQVQPTHRPSEP